MSPEERTDFDRLVIEAQRRGVPVVDYLDRKGLLLTEQRRIQVRQEALRDFYLLMDRSSAHQWLGPDHKATALDMFNAIKDRLRREAE